MFPLPEVGVFDSTGASTLTSANSLGVLPLNLPFDYASIASEFAPTRSVRLASIPIVAFSSIRKSIFAITSPVECPDGFFYRKFT